MLAALAVAVVAGVIASTGDVPAWEEWLFRRLNDLPDRLRPLMWVAQLAGLLLVPIGAAVVAAAFGRFRLAIGLIALVPLKLFVEKAVVKQLVERERPGTTICAGDPGCGNFRDVPLDGLSFVSGHAIIAWAVATMAFAYLPGRWRWVPVAIAVANSIARVYLGAHNPLDVVGGGAVGVALGCAMLIAVSTLPERWDRPSATPSGRSAASTS
jgi:undecaprenyl-diphosphatase